MLQDIINNMNITLKPMVIFLGIIVFLGICAFLMSGRFDINKKRMTYLGLFIGMRNTQIVSVGLILIRLFYIIYMVCIANENILVGLSLIVVTDIIYIIFNPRKIIFEPINISAQIILIYFIHILRNYQGEISNQNNMQYIVIALSTFVIIYAIYCFLKGFEDILKKGRKKKNEKRSNN